MEDIKVLLPTQIVTFLGAVVAVQVFPVSCQNLSSSYPSKISLGIYKMEVTGPLLYESFIPLVYEYEVPVYKSLDITLRDWRGKCDTDSYTPSYTCPIFYHFEKFIERFEQEVVPKAWVDPTSKRSTAPSLIKELGDFCNTIQKHFKGFLTQEFGFEEYVQRLENCLNSALHIKRAISDYVFDLKALFKKMNDNYENEFSNKFFGETNKKIGPAFYVNAVTSHQNGLLLAYWIEKSRWTTAQLACNQQRVPEILIKPQNISTSVQDLNNRLAIRNKKTALPLEEVSSIYKLPLTDCTFVENTGHFVVRILIPVIKQNISPKLYTLETVPYSFADEAGEEHICEMKPVDGKFLYDATNGGLQYTDCKTESSLCQVTEWRDVVTDLCVKAIFSNSAAGVKRFCKFSCYKKNETFGILKFPIVKQIASNTWIVSGSRKEAKDEVSVQCDGNDSQWVLEIPQTGALEVRLPCHCHIVFKSDLLHPVSPCVRNIKIMPYLRHVIPSHFLKDSPLQQYSSMDLASVTLTSSSFNFNLLGPSPISGDNRSPQRLEGGMGNGTSNGNNRVTTVTPSSADSEPRAQLGILWALVILQLIIIMVILAFGIYRYVKHKQDITYSKERLVYNIYASPSDPNIAEST